MADVGVTITGEEGDDTLWTAEGDAILNAGAGGDVLFSDKVNDTLTRGTGADIFDIVPSETNQTDTIRD